MSDLDIQRRLETATEIAFTTPIDAEADLARGQRGRRRRRVGQVVAGTSACAIAGAAVVAGLPALGDDDPSGESTPTSVAVASDHDGASKQDILLFVGNIDAAFRDHLGFTGGQGMARFGPTSYAHRLPLDDAGESVLKLRIRDDARTGGAPVPLRCADDPAYDTCERRTAPDGSKIVVGKGEDDRIVLSWGRGGDLVQVAAHAAGGDVSMDQLVGLATDNRLYVGGSIGPAKDR